MSRDKIYNYQESRFVRYVDFKMSWSKIGMGEFSVLKQRIWYDTRRTDAFLLDIEFLRADYARVYVSIMACKSICFACTRRNFMFSQFISRYHEFIFQHLRFTYSFTNEAIYYDTWLALLILIWSPKEPYNRKWSFSIYIINGWRDSPFFPTFLKDLTKLPNVETDRRAKY